MADQELPPPFDPEDPFNLMADMFRRHVIKSVLDAQKITLFRELPPEKQLAAIISGSFTGAICAVFAQIKPQARDAIMKYAEECVPFARLQAESMRNKDGKLINFGDS